MIHLRKDNRRAKIPTTWCGADPTLEIAVRQDAKATCLKCLVTATDFILNAVEEGERFLANFPESNP
jgi:hypothetical protein